jgi:hypothetical protein
MPIPTARGSLLSSNLFPADNPWNQNISQAPVATNSAAIINSIIAKYGNGRFHPDSGQNYQLADNRGTTTTSRIRLIGSRACSSPILKWWTLAPL